MQRHSHNVLHTPLVRSAAATVHSPATPVTAPRRRARSQGYLHGYAPQPAARQRTMRFRVR